MRFQIKLLSFTCSPLRLLLSSPILTLSFSSGNLFEFSWKEAIELFVRTAIKIVGCWTKAIEVEGCRLPEKKVAFSGEKEEEEEEAEVRIGVEA